MASIVKPSQLGPAGALDGSEIVVLSKGGSSVRALLSAIRTYIREGLIGDAPSDGGVYARVNGAWVDITDRLNPEP